MKRTFARWIISLHQDSERGLPNWVLEFARSDPPTSEYLDQSQRLTQALRESAVDWAEEGQADEGVLDPPGLHPPGLPDFNQTHLPSALDASQDPLETPTNQALPYDSSPSTHSRFHVRRTLGIAALCATLLALAFWIAGQPALLKPSDPPRQLAIHSADKQVDLRPIVASFTAGQQVFRKVADGSQSLFAKYTVLTDLLGVDQGLAEFQNVRLNLRMTGKSFGAAWQRLSPEESEENANVPSHQLENRSSAAPVDRTEFNSTDVSSETQNLRPDRD